MNAKHVTCILTTLSCVLTMTGCQISRIVYRPQVPPSFEFRGDYDIVLAADFIQEPPPALQESPKAVEEEEPADAPADDVEEVVGPPYTVPGPRYRQLAVLAVGVAAFGINDGTGSGKEAGESQISGSSISVVGRPGLSAAPPRVNSAIVGRPGLQQGFAAGLGPAGDRNIFTIRANPLSGPNGRCQDLVNAGFFSGSRAGCETHFRP